MPLSSHKDKLHLYLLKTYFQIDKINQGNITHLIIVKKLMMSDFNKINVCKRRKIS